MGVANEAQPIALRIMQGRVDRLVGVYEQSGGGRH